jgi:hypothetical protein
MEESKRDFANISWTRMPNFKLAREKLRLKINRSLVQGNVALKKHGLRPVRSLARSLSLAHPAH